MRAIVTGNRTYANAVAIRAALRTLPESSTVVHGGCPTGADIIADRIARAMGHVPEIHPAEWHVHGPPLAPFAIRRWWTSAPTCAFRSANCNA
jgi:Ni,Fe-hydrogenase III small subunit